MTKNIEDITGTVMTQNQPLPPTLESQAPALAPSAVPTPVQQDTSIGALIARMAMDPASDVGKLERLLVMKNEQEAREAHRLYIEAMRAVQAEIPKVKKDRRNDATNSMYATLESLNDIVVPIYTRHGFSLSFGTSDSPIVGCIRVTCEIAHDGGHTKSVYADVPMDNKGPKGNQNKTETHAFGSSVAYGRRYLTLLIFNITVGGEDNDGNVREVECITPDQLLNLQALIEEVKADMPKFLAYFKIERLDTLPAAQFKAAIRSLEQKRKQKPQAA